MRYYRVFDPLLHHAAHSTHAAHIRHCWFFWFWLVSDNRFGCQEHGRNGCSVLKSGTRYFRRVNDTCFEHVHPRL